METPILVSTDGPIATVTLNRPEKRNALNKAAWNGLASAMRALSEDKNLRCVVIRGAGDKAFAAGADISGFEEERSSSALVRDYAANIADAFDAVGTSLHPVVAMIHGHCYGGGCELAMACDLRIADESATFAIPAKRLGLHLEYELIDALVNVVGRATALEIVLEGRVYGAAEALAKGLVTRVVPDAELEEEAYATARRIAEGAPLAARWHRRAIRRMADPTPLTEAEITASFSYADTEDYHHGYQAFLAKKSPAFKGR